jgi:DNA-binding MarR family transcriptional regulator
MLPVEHKAPPPAAEDATEEAFRALVRTIGLLERAMQPYFARFGISGSQWGVLRTLHRAEREGESGLRLTDLSDRLLIRPPSVTGVVDRLERIGLVVRDASPTDLRAKNVVLTDKGRQLVTRVIAVHRAQMDRVLGGLTLPERAQLGQLLDRLGQHLGHLIDNGWIEAEATPAEVETT